MLLLTVALILFTLMLCGTAASAIVLGGKPEQQAGWAILIAFVASQIATIFGSNWHEPEYAVMAVDAVFFAWLARLACRSLRWWPIFAAAAQLDGTVMHGAPMIVRNVPDTLYLVIQPVWSLLVLTAIFWGTMNYWLGFKRERAGNAPLGE